MQAPPTTSFVKKINTAPQLYKKQKGVRPFSNSQYCLSSGNPHLDSLIGGGFPVGAVILMIEDQFSHFYSQICKTYLADGILNDQKCCIVDLNQATADQAYWIKQLPSVVKVKPVDNKGEVATAMPTDSELNIAWRYQHLLKEDDP